MRAKRPFLIVGFLCCWTVLSYVIYLRQTDSTRTGNELLADVEHSAILKKLKILEANIKSESERHDELVRQLINIAKLDPAFKNVRSVQTNAIETDYAIEFKNVDKMGPVHKVAVGHVERIDTDQRGRITDEVSGPLTNEVSVVREISLQQNQPIADDRPPQVKLKALLKENVANNNFKGPVIPVLVFACNRVSVRICIENLLKYRPNAGQFPIIVSQVCFHYPASHRMAGKYECY